MNPYLLALVLFWPCYLIGALGLIIGLFAKRHRKPIYITFIIIWLFLYYYLLFEPLVILGPCKQCRLGTAGLKTLLISFSAPIVALWIGSALNMLITRKYQAKHTRSVR